MSSKNLQGGNKKLRILYFGRYSAKYPRNAVILAGLRANGVLVNELNSKNIFWPIDLLINGILAKKFDVIFVAYPGHLEVFIAKIIGVLRKKPVVLDKFYSLYDTFILDRKILPNLFPFYFPFKLLDYFDCLLADLILLDTQQNINFFLETYSIQKNKFFKLFVGAFPNKLKHSKSSFFTVLFFGRYIPLQGTKIIIKSAEILKNKKNIRFVLVGKGQDFYFVKKYAVEKKIDNVLFLGECNISKIKSLVASASLGLGVFGSTGKTKRVIPNKCFEIIAAGKPLLTANTPAIRELLIPEKDCLTCKEASEIDLARKIIYASNNFGKIKKIGLCGKKVYLKKATPRVIGLRLSKKLFDFI